MSDLTPKTVTFNAPPQTEAQHRSARFGSRIIANTLGLAAVILAGVALLWSLNLAVSLAVSWGEALKLSLVAIGVTGALVGLPIAAAILARSYPKESDIAMKLWAGALTIAVFGMLLFVIQLERTGKNRAQTAQSEVPRQSAIARAEARVREDVWYYSNGCSAPQDGFQRRHCREVIEARRGGRSWDFSPRAILPIGGGSSDGPVRRLLVLFLGLGAVIGAGLLGRLAVLATAESYRLGEGMASPEPGPSTPTIADMSGTAALTPADAFSLWANGRLIPVAGGEVTGNEAYEDYVETCRLNGIEPMASTKFGTLLTTRAAASDGRVVKMKSGGKMVYRGWQLPGLLEEASDAHFLP